MSDSAWRQEMKNLNLRLDGQLLHAPALLLVGFFDLQEDLWKCH